MFGNSLSRSASSSRPAESAPVRTKRRYGASCELCRRRKRKCPGRDSSGNSLCTHCSEVGVKCVFPPSGGAPRASKVISEVESLKSYIRTLASATDEEREKLLTQWTSEHGLELGRQGAEMDESRYSESGRPSKKLRSSGDEDDQGSQYGSDDEIDSDELPISDLKLSLEPVDGKDKDAPVPSTQNATLRWVDHYVSRSFPGLDTDGPTYEETQILFDNYFCWQNPRNSICDRTVLERAMHDNDSTYFSPFLIWSLYAHCVRHIPAMADRSDEYAAKAHLLSASALSRPSSFPSIQGLVLLASHLAARGRYSEAWTLTGSAVAMVLDLECHLEMHKPQSQNMSPRSQRLRQTRITLFWVTFTWDKTISLSMNRPSFMSLSANTPPFPEHKRSSELWRPATSGSISTPALLNYPPQPLNHSECFYQSCHVWQILDEVLPELYGKQRRRPLQMRDFVHRIRETLLSWESQVPRDVLIDLDAPVLVPPPPHIIQFNLLVRLTWILLYRPFYNSGNDDVSVIPHATATCERSAKEIFLLLVAYSSVFPLSRISYVYVYAAFLAATIDLSVASREQEVSREILHRLAVAYGLLDAGSNTVPGMTSSVAKLRRALYRLLQRQKTTATYQHAGAAASAAESPTSFLYNALGPDLTPSPPPPAPLNPYASAAIPDYTAFQVQGHGLPSMGEGIPFSDSAIQIPLDDVWSAWFWPDPSTIGPMRPPQLG